jgi:hypothetical protein
MDHEPSPAEENEPVTTPRPPGAVEKSSNSLLQKAICRQLTCLLSFFIVSTDGSKSFR